MLGYEYANKPRDIHVYLNTSEIKHDCDDYIHFDNVSDMGDSVIITWREEKALYAGLEQIPENLKEKGKKFIDETTQYLTTKGFTDLGKINMGYFITEPHYRWFDLQPSIETKQDCIQSTNVLADHKQ